MAMMINKLRQLSGLEDTKDVSDWENKFIKDVVVVGLERAEVGIVTGFTASQEAKINELYERHFAA